MLNRILILFVPVSLLLSSCGDRNSRRSTDSLKERGVLTVAMDVNMPGYFVLNGENYGYQYDLLKAYADHLGVALELAPPTDAADYARLFESGQADMIATLTGNLDACRTEYAMPVYTTSYVILARKAVAAEFTAQKPPSLSAALKGRKLAVSGGFRESDLYDVLLDSLRGTNIYRSSGNSMELIELLGRGVYDYLICEKSEAQLGCALVRNVRQVFGFAEPVSMSLVLNGAVNGLREDFTAWYDTYRNSDEYAMLNELYFERGIVGQLIGRNVKRKPGGISPYDDLLRMVGAQEGYDWRMLSAIAWNESRFNEFIVSHQGAKGLMQIMPVVARQFEVDETEVMKPEVNVRLAAKLLNKIERTLRLPKDMPSADRMSLVLACYNAGIGHVIDARNLAAKYGGNPDSWADVSVFLSLKSEPDYMADEVVKCGRFIGGEETLAFVDKVMGKYQSYCNVVAR